jgi:hypothetical protein
MFKAVQTTKKRKEYAQEVTFIAKRSRRGHIKHKRVNVTPSSSQISPSPIQHESQAEEPIVIPSLSSSQLSHPPSPQSGLSVDENDYSQQEKDSTPSNSGDHRSSKRGKECLFDLYPSIIKLTEISNL